MPVYRYSKKSGSCWLFKCSINGRQFLRRGFTSKSAARQAELSFMLRNRDRDPSTAQIRFSQLYEDFFEHYKQKVKATTYHMLYGSCKKWILDIIGDLKLESIVFADFERWRTVIERSPLGLNRKNRYFSLLQEMFEYSAAFYSISFPFFKRLLPFREDQRPEYVHRRALTFAEFLRIYNEERDQQLKLCFLLTFFTGCRINEVRALRLRDLDGDRLSVHLQAVSKLGKGKVQFLSLKTKSSERSYLLPDFLIKILQHHFKFNNLSADDFIFFSSRSKQQPIAERKIRESFNADCVRLGIKDDSVVFHSLRHSEATLLDDAGFKTKDIASYLGHSSDAITKKTYIHARAESREEIKKYLDTTFGDKF